jgi:hypothetical protein
MIGRHFLWITASMLLLMQIASGQEASSGIQLPVTVGADARVSGSSADGYAVSGGFRALLSPELQLGPHWFAYSVLGAQSSNYFDYTMGADNDNPVSFSLLQAYAGYKAEFKAATLLLKGGRLASAFGHYPLEYDDSKSPLIDPPSIYATNLVLRPDQVPCNIRNIVGQSYDQSIEFGCGGSTSERYGIVPVTLSGIPGIEAQLAWSRFDGRVQLTNSSPANPQSLLSRSQFVQWTAGAGYSFHQGLHLGVSGFRGPYLENVVLPFLPKDTSVAAFTASGLGFDAQWLGGPWSVEGEWQRFRFAVPGFIQSPSIQGAYVQAKRIISPRLFAAIRSNWERPGGAIDALGAATSRIDARQETEEFVLGYRISRFQLLKTGFTFADRNAWSFGHRYWPAEQHLGFELQLVTSLSALSKGFH